MERFYKEDFEKYSFMGASGIHEMCSLPFLVPVSAFPLCHLSLWLLILTCVLFICQFAQPSSSIVFCSLWHYRVHLNTLIYFLVSSLCCPPAHRNWWKKVILKDISIL